MWRGVIFRMGRMVSGCVLELFGIFFKGIYFLFIIILDFSFFFLGNY